MKLYSKIYSIMAALAVGMTAGGCSDDSFDNGRNWQEGDREVEISLNLPSYLTPLTRAVDDNAIADIKAYYYNGENALDPEIITSVVNNKITLKVPGGATKVKLVANHTACGLGTSGNEMTFNPNDKSNLVFYGETTVANLETNQSIDLYRSCARSTFTNSAKDFTIVNLYFCGKPSKGLVAYNSTSDLQNLPDAPGYASYSAISDADKVVYDEKTVNSVKQGPDYYHYEAEKGKCFWIIEGKYDGSETSTFYKVAYIKQDPDKNLENTTTSNNAEELPIIRNNHYKFTITDVNADGYATFAEATAAKPDNRLQVLLQNYEETVYNMVSCRDYYLGVPNEVRKESGTEGHKVIVEFKVVSNYSKTPTVELDDKLCTFASVPAIGAGGTAPSNTDGKVYKVTLQLDPNTDSAMERGVGVVVKAGDLTQTVQIWQEGSDFFFGDNRWKVGIVAPTTDALPTGFEFSVMEGLPSEFLSPNNVKDYFMMLKNDAEGGIKGETEEEMGVPRNDGLHFAVYVKDESLNNQYKYRIPKEGKECTSEILEGDGKFTCEEKDDYWEIACTAAGNKNYEIWHGRLKLTKGNQTVSYEIYHTGIFHQLTGNHQLAGPDNKKATGWFYYEQVDVKGADENIYHILDRNIGASSNKFYSPSSTFSRVNTASRGAYFCVETIAGMGEVEKVLPEGFNSLPGKYHFLQILPTVVSAADLQSGWQASGNSLQSWIYLPVAGAMDGANHVDEMHAQLWSGTMVEGLQGFFPGESDYGLWYRVLDYNGTATVPTVRIQSRATGAYRGIPIRAMSCPPAVPGADLPDVANSRSRIILSNDAGWSEVFIRCSDGIDTFSKMVKGDDKGTWYYIDLIGQPGNVYFFGDGKITDTYSVNLNANLVERFSNASSKEDDKIRLFVNNWAAWDGVKLYHDKLTNWDSRYSIARLENTETWYYTEIPATVQKIKFTSEKSEGYSQYPGSGTNIVLTDSKFSQCYTTHILVLDNYDCQNPTFKFPDTSVEYKTYRVKWQKFDSSNSNCQRPYIYVWNFPDTTLAMDRSGISSNNCYSGKEENGSYYFYFKIPYSVNDYNIGMKMRVSNTDWNNDWDRGNFEPNIKNFTLNNGIYEYEAY